MVWISVPPPSDPPAVQPPTVPTGCSRDTLSPGAAPRFSVMIPTYRPDERHLRQTLHSVLAQAPPADSMQIMVVDDTRQPGSTAAIIRSVDPHGRIEVVENERRLGIAGNWNRAIAHARGELVHLLHQDDYVLPGFYDRIDRGFRQAPSAGMAVCRSRIIDDRERHVRLNSRLRLTAGLIHDWLPQIAVRQRVQTPAAVVRREIYESVGGFHTDLFQALDWEMWVRIAARYAVWYEPRALAVYRRHGRNESSRLLVRNEVWPDLARAIRMNAASLPAASRAMLTSASGSWYSLSGLRTAERHVRRGELHEAVATLESLTGLLELSAGGPRTTAVSRRLAVLRRRLLAAAEPRLPFGLRPAA
jgi:glycosyltransferase involved in cell wall biosynthesis